MATDGKPTGGIKANVSNLFQRLMVAARAGLSFGGRRNMYKVFGYPDTLTSEHLLAKYQRQDITSRVVDMPPEEMWSVPPVMVTPEGEKDKWDDFAKRMKLWERIIQADKLLSFGEYSVLWLGLPGLPKSAAPKVTDVEDFLYVQAYGGENVKIKTYEDNTSNPRYGQPVVYEVRVGPNKTQSMSQDVHFSRIVHIVDRPLQGLMSSEPRLAQIYNTLDDIFKTSGGSAETYWLTANRGIQADIDKEMELDPKDAEALSDELEEYQHDLRRFIRTRGVKITPLGSEVADPRGVFEVLISILSATTSIPQRILMGAEAGQLASEQDRANWAEYIGRRRAVFGVPFVLRPIIERLEGLKYLKEDTALETAWQWEEAFHVSPLEYSQIVAANARAAVNLSRRNQFGNPLLTDEEARRMLGMEDKPKGGETMPKAPAVKGGGGKPSSGAGDSEQHPASTNPPTVAE